MVSDQQVKRLWRVAPKLSLEVAAAKAGMDAKTARKYLRARRLPSEMQQKHTWRTRPDPFADFWDELAQRLQVDPGLQAKTLFEYLQEREPGRFQEGQLRTLQRRIKNWRAVEGPPREVFFAQEHYPCELCQPDFHALPRTVHHDQRAGIPAPVCNRAANTDPTSGIDCKPVKTSSHMDVLQPHSLT